MNERILILSTCFRPNVGGVETHLDDLLSTTSQKGFEFFVVTYQPLVTEAKGEMLEKTENSLIIRILWLRMNLFLKLEKYPALEFLYLFPGLFISSLIFLFLKRQSVKTIHAQGLVAGVIGVFLSKLFKIPLIVSTHSIYNFPKKGLYKNFVKWLFKNSKHVLTLSKQSAREVLNLGIERDKVSTFTYWVDQKLFTVKNKEAARSVLKLSKKSFLCLFVGRLIAVKGIEQLIEAAKITEGDIKFIIVGDGPMAKDIEEIARKNRKIIFRGRIDNKELVSYYNSADILIVPSIHEEGFGRVILEALSCGLPVIAANRRGIKEALSKDVGIFIDINPEKIKEALENLINNPHKVKFLASKASSYAKKRFNFSNARMITKYYG